jgi:hypothetical protein
MKKFNMICEILSGELNKRNSIILEHVYFDSLFKTLLTYCSNHLMITDELLKLTYSDLNTLIDKHWSGKKYLNKHKELYILFSENIDKIDWLTEIELTDIQNRLKFDDGLFCSGFENNQNTSLIILNDIEYSEYNRVLMHEFIHFFQWNLGKSIYQFQSSVLDDKEVEEISKILNFDKSVIQSMITYIQDAQELESYCNNIFDYLKEFCKEHNLIFNKFVLKAICDCCYNKFDHEFNEFYKNVQKNLKQYLNIDVEFESKYLIYILLLGYFKHGYNSFKNHLFGYYENRRTNK